MVAQGVAIIPVTSTVVSMVVGEGVITLSPEGGEWMTMTLTLLEAMDSIALSMVDDKKPNKDHFIKFCSMYMCAITFCTCTCACVALGILCTLNLGILLYVHVRNYFLYMYLCMCCFRYLVCSKFRLIMNVVCY